MPPHLPVILALFVLLDSRVVRSFHSPTQMSPFLVPKQPVPSQKTSAASSTSTFAMSSTGTAFQRTSALQAIPERSDGGRGGGGGGGGDDIFSFLKDQLGDEFGTSINIVQGGSGGMGDGGFGPPPEAGGANGAGENDKASESLESLRSFDLKPREVVEYLDRFVIQQYDAKKVLAVAICDHYNHCRRCLEEDGFDSASKANDLGYDDPFADAMEETRSEYAKPNVLLAGPTGVGKTYLLKNLAQLVGVPFVKADATKFSETGIVGRDAEDLVRDLVDAAGGNTTLASMGIIYVDEVDKIAGGGNDGGATNRGGFNTKGVQNNFLKLLEDTDVSLERQGEMQFVLPAALGGSDVAKQSVNTRNILFIFSGAFSGLDKDIRQKREKKPFGIDLMAQLDEPISNNNQNGNVMEDDEDINRPPGKGQSYLRYAETADFVRAGLEPEFVGRVPVRVALNALDASDLKQILIGAEGSVLKQFKRDFMGYNIRMDATDDALTAISELAEREGTGARGLVTILERTLREHKFELPSTSVTRFEMDADTVRTPNRSLKQLLKSESAGDGAGIKLRDLKRWETKLNRKLPDLVSAWLTDDAQTYLLRRSMSKKHEHQSAFSFAGQYFGTMLEKVILLIHGKTGQAAFPISLDVAMDPEVELRKWMSSLEGSSEDESDVVVDATVLEESKRDVDPPRKKKVRSDK
eukprot:CAMPEP_0194443352 /NCGR_PEP_ID=MMETSP0176-20130528/126654_1 /TAXON_ID=216777 /ORGANISM="Proboscia alata, Strain PI-D3" /LENGTH=694 /DNA_ID=CAMNT_0039269581 /DNA_START=161 /DNA_END=2245 /DNA_ORIENTATION=+